MYKIISTIIIGLFLISCGSNDGRTEIPSGEKTPPSATTISSANVTYFAAKVDGGTCNMYLKDAAGKTISTSPPIAKTVDGVTSFSDVGIGPTLIECGGGTYIDEATNSERVATSLTSVVNVAIGDGNHYSVTPLTDLSYRKVGMDPTAISMVIDEVNKSVAEQFGLTNIVNTQPSDLENPAITSDNLDPANDEDNYGVILAVLSQIVEDKNLSKTDTAAVSKELKQLDAQEVVSYLLSATDELEGNTVSTAASKITAAKINTQVTPVNNITFSRFIDASNATTNAIGIGEKATAEVSFDPVPTNAIILYTSTNPNIATVNKYTGVVTGVAIGTTNIIATADDNSAKFTMKSIRVFQSLTGSFSYSGNGNVNMFEDEVKFVVISPESTLIISDGNTKTFTVTSDIVAGSITVNNVGVVRIDGRIAGSGSYQAIVSVIAAEGDGTKTATLNIVIQSRQPVVNATTVRVARYETITQTLVNIGGQVASCYSNNLPTGFTASAVNGSCQITGKSDVKLTQTATIILKNSINESSNVEVTFKVIVARPSINDYTLNGVRGTNGVWQLIAGDTSGKLTSCTELTGGLFNTISLSVNSVDNTCQFTGTPRVVVTGATYTIMAKNDGNNGTDTAILTVNIKDAKPSITLSTDSVIVSVGDLVNVTATYTVTNTTGAPTLYHISPDAENGLTFNIFTGALSGTPIKVAPRKIYTITATNNNNDSASTSEPQTIAITVKPDPPIISLSSNEINAVVGSTIRVSVFNTGGTEGITYIYTSKTSIGDDSFFGLMIDGSNGDIYGTLSQIGSGTFTLTATNDGGSDSATFFINITSVGTETTPTLTFKENDSVTLTKSFEVGQPITPIVIDNSGSFVTSYSVNPSLPMGLVLANNTISGTPIVKTTSAVYTITGTNGQGSDEVTLILTTTLTEPILSLADTSTRIYKIGQEIVPVTFVNSGGVAHSCEQSEVLPLPSMLVVTLTNGTCVISGTPLTTQTLTTFMISATNDEGTSEASITLSVVEQQLVISTTTLTFNEDQSEVYTIKLNSKPSGIVYITPFSSDTTIATVVNTSALVFNNTNWNIAQPVTIAGVDDRTTLDHLVVINHTLTYTITAFDNYANASVTATVKNIDTVGVKVSTTSVTSTEIGTAGTYTIELQTQPADTVTIMPSSNNIAATASPTSLNFTVDDWFIPQVVTVIAVDDDNSVNEVDVVITHGISGGNYDAVVVGSVAVTIVDNDPRGVTISTLSANTIEEGSSVIYTVVLNSQPTGTVTVRPMSSNAATVTVSATLTFTTEDWDMAKTVTLTAVQDDDAADEVGVTITHTVTGADYGANNVTASSVIVNVTDDDSVTLILSTTTASVNEGAAGVDYTIKLSAQPTGGDVTITVASDNAAATVASTPPLPLTFTDSTWNTPQTLTITAPQDANATDETVNISHTASGADYGDADPVTVTVTVMDNNTPGLALAELNNSGAIEVTQGLGTGGTATYTIVLVTEPTGPVTVGLTAEGAGVSVSPSPLTFTTSTWSVAQVVTVTAEADPDAIDDVGTITYTISGGGYDDVTQTATVVDILDGDVAGIRLSTSTISLSESLSSNAPVTNTTSSYTVQLITDPGENVTVTITPSSTGDIVTVTPTTTVLMFTGGTGWNTPQTVTISSTDDSVPSNSATATITHEISSNYNAEGTTPTIVVTVTDSNTVYTPTAIVQSGMGNGNMIRFEIIRPLIGTLTANEFRVMVAGSSPTSTTQSTNTVAVNTVSENNKQVLLTLERAIVDNNSGGPAGNEANGEALTLTFTAATNNAQHNLESFTETAVMNDSIEGDCSGCIVDSKGCLF